MMMRKEAEYDNKLARIDKEEGTWRRKEIRKAEGIKGSKGEVEGRKVGKMKVGNDLRKVCEKEKCNNSMKEEMKTLEERATREER